MAVSSKDHVIEQEPQVQLGRLITESAVVLTIAYGLVWLLSLGHLGFWDTAALSSALSYQLWVLPRQIWRNFKARRIEEMSSELILIGAASYVSATTRSALQPDWVDVLTRAVGATASLIIVMQLVYFYLKTRRRKEQGRLCKSCNELAGDGSWARPCCCGREFHLEWKKVHQGFTRVMARCVGCDSIVHTYESPLGSEELRLMSGYYCYLSFNLDLSEESWVKVKPEEYVQTAQEYGVPPYASYWAYPEWGVAGFVTTFPSESPLTEALLKGDVVTLPAL